jgi:C_GCAxxG_C_C family probable redox protein
MDKEKCAEEYFEKGKNCAQAVLLAFASECGLDPNLALKIATGFGGGMGRSSQTCGAVSGAVMVLGLVTSDGTPASKEKTYAAVRRFIERFSASQKSVNCTELIGYDLGDPLQFEEARRLGKTKEICPGLVKEAVKSLTGTLAEIGKI